VPVAIAKSLLFGFYIITVLYAESKMAEVEAIRPPPEPICACAARLYSVSETSRR
jgi:hypothetical protein